MSYFRKNTRTTFLLALLAVVAVASFSFAAAVKPSRGSSISSWSEFVSASPFSQNYVIDKARLWLPVTGGSQVTATGIVGLATGTPVPTEINSSGFGGFLLDANNESVAWVFPLPPDIDVAKDINFRVLHSNSEAAGTGTIKYTCVYKPFVTGTTAFAVPATAMDTVGTAVADLAANIPQWSSTQVLDGGTLTGTPGEDFLALDCAVTLVTCANSTIYGVEMEYHRKFIGGGGSY